MEGQAGVVNRVTARSWPTLMLLLALIAGVAAMHTVGHDGHEPAADTATTVSAGHTGHTEDDSVPTDGMTGFMCLALLVAVGVLVWARTRPVAVLRHGRKRRRASPFAVRRAPPSRYALLLTRVAVLRI